MPPLIRNISDTARWVAMYRAMESERPDALFHDRWARTLAGERGRAIFEGLPRGSNLAWPMIVRTAVMDEIIEREVAAGADTVVNLAAGMDMRPYRLRLPASLRWVEVDLAPILDEKEALIAGETPCCELERIRADLADEGARRASLARALAASTRALIVSEGLLIYLDDASVAALARDLAAEPAARLWLFDIAHPKLLAWLSKRSGRFTAEGGAPFRFAPANNTAFFEPFGWREREYRGGMHEALRLKRMPPFFWLFAIRGLFMSKKTKAMYQRFSGYALLERA